MIAATAAEARTWMAEGNVPTGGILTAEDPVIGGEPHEPTSSFLTDMTPMLRSAVLRCAMLTRCDATQCAALRFDAMRRDLTTRASARAIISSSTPLARKRERFVFE